jgi:HAD superfamily hydrolase (TIGR01450 family)
VTATGAAAPDDAPNRRFAGYVFDLDGTLYLGDHLLPGAAETLAAIRSSGAQVLFLTNNPTRLPAEYAAKLTALGIPARREDVVSSIDALIDYLDRRWRGRRLLAIAEPLLVGVLGEAGYELTTDPGACDGVVVAWDRTFDYARLTAAFRAVRAGAPYVATNPDPYCPTPDGGLPDCAAMVAAIEASTGIRPEAIVGKPSTYMAATVIARLRLDPADVVVVGDRLGTDVGMARASGMCAALVLTGATRRADVVAAEVAPDYVLDDVSQLIGGWPDQTG